MNREQAREELRGLAAATRGLLEWHEATGSDGVPVADPGAARASLAAGSKAAKAPPQAPPAKARVDFDKESEPAPRSEIAHVQAKPLQHAPSKAEVARSVESPEERRTRLALIQEEVRECTRCGLHPTRTNTVFARGNPFAEICFVGEGPGADEDAQGEPFVGRAGQLLDKMIVAMGYAREDVYICNIVKCRPPENRKPEPDEMDACAPYMHRQLELVKPKVIVALGATAVQGLIGSSTGITKMRGTWKLYKGTVPIMPTFHPAYLLRQPGAKRDVWNDLKDVLRYLGKNVPA